MLKRFGKLITAAFFVIGLGVLLFLLTPLFYGQWGLDTDLLGLIILTTGLAIMLIGVIRRKKLHGWKLVVMSILAGIFLLPLVPLLASTIYYVITGKPLGN